MASYRLFFLDKSGSIQARDEFTAEDDACAFFIARRVFDACSDVYTSYEVWSGVRRIAFPAPAGIQTSVKQRLDGSDEDHTTQMIVVERERILLDSHWTAARSRRLLHEMNKLQSALLNMPASRNAKHP